MGIRGKVFGFVLLYLAVGYGRPPQHLQASSTLSSEEATSAWQEALRALHEAAVEVSRYPVIVGPVSATGSMRPAIGDHDLVLIEWSPYHLLRKGDVVRIGDSEKIGEDSTITLHRIVGGEPGAWITRGDNARQTDARILTPTRYRGRAIGVLWTRKDDV